MSPWVAVVVVIIVVGSRVSWFVQRWRGRK
jgi:hypothetical protein